MTSRRLLDPATKVLLEAADYIDIYGWCQHVQEKDSGELCAMGAIAKVISNERWDFNLYCGATKKVKRYLGLHSRGTQPIQYWNDRTGRTKAEVIAALRGAALDDHADE